MYLCMHMYVHACIYDICIHVDSLRAVICFTSFPGVSVILHTLSIDRSANPLASEIWAETSTSEHCFRT